MTNDDILEVRYQTDLEIRGGDGRTIAGIAVPYDTPTDISGRYTESFKKGAFAKTIRDRSNVRLFALHDTKSLPLGRATSLREDAAGLYAEFRVSRTNAGDEALELVRDGALDSFSIGFVPVRDKWATDRSTVERQEVALREVSLVSFPAYAGARIEAVRAFDADDPQSAPRLSIWRARLHSL